ncbi:Heat shock cognate 70 kDa protein 2 [Taenia crassiceps]|uniref:Heat shock cognate 70 kDa protein 2 n=1 Tax=Taenia crassiceps TaxID=6207 RepID=A0ABR4QI73_9CEST
MNSPVAIDLGDSFCRVGLYKPHDDRVTIVPDFEGYSYCCYSIPSYVAFVNNARLVGTTARIQSVRVPHKTICRTKSLLGKRFFEVEKQLSNVTFQVTPDGSDFDRPLINDKKTHNLLRRICERSKRDLSSKLDSELVIRGVLPDIPVRVAITRAQFEEMCQDIFRAAMEPIDEALRMAGLKIDDIEDVVILGGSARIPKIDLLLREKFHRKQINKRLHSEETVVYGAALYAAQLAKMLPTLIRVYDVTNHSIGIEQPHCVVSLMIPRNIPVPCTVRRIFSTAPDGDQSHLTLRLYEGAHAKTTGNTFLGSFDINELLPAFGGGHEVTVDFEVDTNGILKVTQIFSPRGNQVKHVDITKPCLSTDFKHIACREFARSLLGDAQMRKLFEHRRYLEGFAYLLRAATGAKALDLQEHEVKCLLHESEASLRWLRSNPKAKLEETDAKIMSVQDTVTANLQSTIEELVYHALHFTDPEGEIKYFPIDSENLE